MSASPGPRTPRGTPARKVSVPFTHSSPSSLKAGSASSAGAANAAAAAAKVALLGRNEETTYHRKLRSLLQDHARARNTWIQLVSFDGIKQARAMSVAWEDVDNARATPLSGPQESDAPAKHGTATSYARDMATAEALHRAESAREDLDTVVAKIQSQAARLATLLDQARALLIESAKAKGFEFVSETPLWGTWTMDRFAQALGDATTPYMVCTAHLVRLATTLKYYARNPLADADRPALPQASLGVPVSASSLFAGESPAEASESDSKRPGASAIEPARRIAMKAQNEAMQAWARLPHLDEVPGRFLDDVCDVEVGRWSER